MKAVILLSGGLTRPCMSVAKSRLVMNCIRLVFVTDNGIVGNYAWPSRLPNIIRRKNTWLLIPICKISAECAHGFIHWCPPWRCSARRHSGKSYRPVIWFFYYAVGYAEVVGAERFYRRERALDYSRYPDCRPEFIAKFQELADYATKTTTTGGKIKLRLRSNIYQKDIVLLGTKNKAPLQFTTSCYNGGEEACSECDSCLLRLKGLPKQGLLTRFLTVIGVNKHERRAKSYWSPGNRDPACWSQFSPFTVFDSYEGWCFRAFWPKFVWRSVCRKNEVTHMSRFIEI